MSERGSRRFRRWAIIAWALAATLLALPFVAMLLDGHHWPFASVNG